MSQHSDIEEEFEIASDDCSFSYSKEKNEIFTVSIKVPIFPDGFVPNQMNYEFEYEKKLNANWILFKKNRKHIIQREKLKNLWFGFWIDNSKQKIVRGFDENTVLSYCPFEAVVTFGSEESIDFVYTRPDVSFL